jgi:cation diffusion facilitator CzcD-associated flavoprotein CzcO
VVLWQQLPSTSVPPATAAATAAAAGGSLQTEQFDAVLVCNGHYSEPQLPQLPGAAGWPGLLMHSHSFRSAERFKGQHVAVIGASFSGARGCKAVTVQACMCAVHLAVQILLP